MKTIAQLLLAATLFATTIAAEARSSRGYSSSTGYYRAPRSDASYVYRNPYAAYPSVNVRDYTRSNGTLVDPHVRTPANDTITDNLNYRGYGTIRVPRY